MGTALTTSVALCHDMRTPTVDNMTAMDTMHAELLKQYADIHEKYYALMSSLITHTFTCSVKGS
jgi:hypothetical protein